MTLEEANATLDAAFDMERACVAAQDAIYARASDQERENVRVLGWPRSTYYLHILVRRWLNLPVTDEQLSRCVAAHLTNVSPTIIRADAT